ncbi:MAG: WYL domain-containing protein [Propylenella sp.]
MVAKTRRTPESSAGGGDSLRWSVERRLAFIEERLFWLGEVNRTDLTRAFGVSASQASKDIARYLEHAPRGLAYDKSVKRYVAGAEFRPVLAEPDAARFLGELRLADLGILPSDATLLGTSAPFDTTPVPERRIDPYLLRAVLGAIRARYALSVTYQSMSREKPTRRRIAPRALAFDGFRWHTRAYDYETQEFRDFVLGRTAKPTPDPGAPPAPDRDPEWESFVELVIGPHPGLTPAQARAIALDYGIVRGSARLKVRRALLYYARKRLGLDVPPDTRPPNEQHIVLLNRAEIDRLRPQPSQT